MADAALRDGKEHHDEPTPRQEENIAVVGLVPRGQADVQWRLDRQPLSLLFAANHDHLIEV